MSITGWRNKLLVLAAITAATLVSGCGGEPLVQSAIPASASRSVPVVTDWANLESDPRLAVSVTTEPATPRVGQSLLLHVRIGNLTANDISGIYVDLGGDWTTTRLVGIRPKGTFRHDPSGRSIVAELQIPPAEERFLDIDTVPEQNGPSHFTFWVRPLTSAELSDL